VVGNETSAAGGVEGRVGLQTPPGNTELAAPSAKVIGPTVPVAVDVDTSTKLGEELPTAPFGAHVGSQGPI